MPSKLPRATEVGVRALAKEEVTHTGYIVPQVYSDGSVLGDSPPMIELKLTKFPKRLIRRAQSRVMHFYSESFEC